MEQKLKEILASVLNVSLDSIGMDSSINNVANWDSLTHLKLVAKLEEELSIRFTEEEFLQLSNFANILRIVESK